MIKETEGAVGGVKREMEREGDFFWEGWVRCVSDKALQAALMKSLSQRWGDCLWNGLLIGGPAAWCSMETNSSWRSSDDGGRLVLYHSDIWAKDSWTNIPYISNNWEGWVKVAIPHCQLVQEWRHVRLVYMVVVLSCSQQDKRNQ